MKNIKFSILIPVYNVEKYLRQCVNSVLSQDYDNIELILVDDGSTDNSGELCDEYASKDERIKVIHKKNEGLLMARRTAIKNATGDYFLFLDSDDYWDAGLLKMAYNNIKHYDCDMLLFNYKFVYPDRTKECNPIFNEKRIFENDKKILYQIAMEGNSLNNLVLKIVSRNIVNIDEDYSIYSEVSNGEDAMQSVPLLICAKKILYVPETYYNYRRNVGMTRRIGSNVLLSITIVREYIEKLFIKTQVDLSKSFGISKTSYMRNLVKHIVYGYIDSSSEFKRTFRKVIDTDYYKYTRKEYWNKLSILHKFIVICAEKEGYFIIRMFSYILKFRNFIKKI